LRAPPARFDRLDPPERFERLEPPDRFFGRAGTLAPFSRASESPIAIACLRLVTFPPLLLFSVPRLRLRMALSTDFCAFLPYLATVAPFRRERGCVGIP
jgi:hypothetical protein